MIFKNKMNLFLIYSRIFFMENINIFFSKMENNKVKFNSSSRKYYCEHGELKYRCSLCGGSQLCVHGRIKYNYRECFGSETCSHSKQKAFCIVCGGSQICSHNKQKSQCKKCSDPIKVTIKNWIKNTRQSDKKNNRYDADRFVDKCFLKGLIEDYPTCYYEDCKTTLQYTEHQENLATIERINNKIGHIKSNCVLCCLSCNNKRKSNSQHKAYSLEPFVQTSSRLLRINYNVHVSAEVLKRIQIY